MDCLQAGTDNDMHGLILIDQPSDVTESCSEGSMADDLEMAVVMRGHRVRLGAHSCNIEANSTSNINSNITIINHVCHDYVCRFHIARDMAINDIYM